MVDNDQIPEDGLRSQGIPKRYHTTHSILSLAFARFAAAPGNLAAWRFEIPRTEGLAKEERWAPARLMAIHWPKRVVVKV